MQATIRDNWGAAEKVDDINLADTVPNRHPAGGYPNVCVIVAEKRLHWFMITYLRNSIGVCGLCLEEGISELWSCSLANAALD